MGDTSLTTFLLILCTKPYQLTFTLAWQGEDIFSVFYVEGGFGRGFWPEEP